MFEKAARLALRFDTPKGQLSVEDLWNLPLISSTGKANLDSLAVQLHDANEQGARISFVEKTTPADDLIKLKFDIVLHIINVRVSENVAAANLKAAREKKQFIMGLIEQKQTEQLAGSSIEDLRKMLDSL